MIKLLTIGEVYQDCHNIYKNDNEFQTIGEPKGKRHRIIIENLEESAAYSIGKALAMEFNGYFSICYDDKTLYIDYYTEGATADAN